MSPPAVGADRATTLSGPRRARTRHTRWVVGVAGLLLVAFMCIDVLNMTQTYVWLDLSQSPHMGAVQHAKPRSAQHSVRAALQPVHAIMPPLPLVLSLFVLLWFVVLPRAPAHGSRHTWRPRLRGPPVQRLAGARL